MQFSLRWLLAAVAFVAVSLVALLNANDVWVMFSRNLARLTVFIAIVGAVWSIGKDRVFWSGYALFVLAYINSGFGILWVTESLTTRALSYLHGKVVSPVTEALYPPIDHVSQTVLSMANQPDGSILVTYIRPMREPFVHVGGAVLSVLIGFLGGLIAIAFYRRRSNQVAPTPPA